LGDKANNLIDDLVEINNRFPVVIGEGKSPRIQGADNRISRGIAKRDGKFVAVILAEKKEWPKPFLGEPHFQIKSRSS
jgi:hypothetical protein